MKLNKTELYALSAQIYEDLQKAAQQKQEELDVIQDEQNTPAAKLALRAIRTMNKTLREYLKATGRDMNKIDLSDILCTMRKKQTEVYSPVYGDKTEIFNALIIAQIDTSDVATLIEKVKASLTAK